MKLRRLKNGRIKDMDTGLFVNKKLAKSFANGKNIPLLRHKKSTKRSKSNGHVSHAVKTLKIREYRDGSFDIETHSMNDPALLYYASFIKAYVDEDLYKEAAKDIAKEDKNEK